jgi:hypothetical protein
LHDRIVPLAVLAGFDPTSWYATLLYVFGGLPVLSAGVREIVAWVRSIRRWLRPQTQAELNARVTRREEDLHSVVMVENTGDVVVEHVEVELPPEGDSWRFIFGVLASYPIPSLDPGDRAAIMIAPNAGAPGAIEVVLRGQVRGRPYERRRTLSLFG